MILELNDEFRTVIDVNCVASVCSDRYDGKPFMRVLFFSGCKACCHYKDEDQLNVDRSALLAAMKGDHV